MYWRMASKILCSDMVHSVSLVCTMIDASSNTFIQGMRVVVANQKDFATTKQKTKNQNPKKS
jgi:hypothetical protein